MSVNTHQIFPSQLCACIVAKASPVPQCFLDIDMTHPMRYTDIIPTPITVLILFRLHLRKKERLCHTIPGVHSTVACLISCRCWFRTSHVHVKPWTMLIHVLLLNPLPINHILSGWTQFQKSNSISFTTVRMNPVGTTSSFWEKTLRMVQVCFFRLDSFIILT